MHPHFTPVTPTRITPASIVACHGQKPGAAVQPGLPLVYARLVHVKQGTKWALNLRAGAPVSACASSCYTFHCLAKLPDFGMMNDG